MFRKYRVFRYIQRQKSGKAFEKDLKEHCKVTDADLISWTETGAELESHYDRDSCDIEWELTGEGHEYIAAIRRKILALVAAALLAVLLDKATGLLSALWHTL